MRIGFVIENLESFGGLEEIVGTLAVALQARGHKIAVLSTIWVPPDNQYRQLLREKNVLFLQWPVMRSLSLLALLAAGMPSLLKDRSFSRAFRAARLWRNEKADHLGWRYITSGRYKKWTQQLLTWWHRSWRPDLLHVHCYTYGIGLAFLLNWSQRKGLPTLFQEHQTPDPQSDIWGGFCKDINKATCVAAVSQESAQVLCEALEVRRPIFVVPPIVSVPVTSAGPKAHSVKADRSSLTIGAITRLIPVKGIHCLLEAFVRVRRARPNLELRIHGDGPQRQDLINCATRLGLPWPEIFVGTFRHEALPQIMLGTDIFVLSSLREGLPLSVIEAMAYGLPIVATSVGGIPEIIEDGKTGLLCPPGDPASLAEKLQILIEDPIRRVHLGQAARIAYERGSFHPDAVCERFEFVYREVLGRSGAARAERWKRDAVP